MRTQAQLTNKVLNEMNHSLEVARANKAGTNQTSFVELERENLKVAKMLQLPPIERIQCLAKNGGKITINGKVIQSQPVSGQASVYEVGSPDATGIPA